MKKKFGLRFAAVFMAVLIALTTLPFSFAESEESDANWVSAWSTSSINASLTGLGILDNVGLIIPFATSRITIQPTISGSSLRIKFSNEFGNRALKIGGCTVANAKKNNKDIKEDTITEVTVHGKTAFSVPRGKTIFSDPVEFDVVAGHKISVSTFYIGLNTFKTIGLIGANTYATFGDYTKKSVFKGLELSLTADSGTYSVIPSITEIDVDASAGSETCVVFGDSTVTNEMPRYFASVLRNNGIKNVSVTQAAIKGNRLLEDGIGLIAKITGKSSLKRFEKDVLDQAGVKHVLCKIGVNDMVHPYCKSNEGKLKPVTLDEMIVGYKALIDLCHKNGVKIYMLELAPWKGYTRNLFGMGDDVNWSMEIDQLRLDINEWFASDDCEADAFIPLPNLHDPADDFAILPAYTTDGAHHTEAGAMTIAESIPVKLFK